MLALLKGLRRASAPPTPEAILKGRRSAQRQLEWAETYLTALESIELDDPTLNEQARLLALAVHALAERVGRPRVVEASR